VCLLGGLENDYEWEGKGRKSVGSELVYSFMCSINNAKHRMLTVGNISVKIKQT
jgi:hypothetical protein